MNKVWVWGLPVRPFHWALAVLAVVVVVCEKTGGNAMTWHFRAGYATLALVLFRMLWGLAGSRYARFSSFSYRPSAIVDHVLGGKNDRLNRSLGHNPLGSLSVFALLGIVLLQAGSGRESLPDKRSGDGRRPQRLIPPWRARPPGRYNRPASAPAIDPWLAAESPAPR